MDVEKERIGIVLAGGSEKGLYEVGALRAVEEFFGRERIAGISAASIGALVGYAFSARKSETFVSLWKEIAEAKAGRFLMSQGRDPYVVERMRGLVGEEDAPDIPLSVALWNFTDRTTEYLPLLEAPRSDWREYLNAAVNVPFFNRGLRLNGKLYFDGGFIDNIPVFPFVGDPPTYIICIYFDPKTNYFENDTFNRRVIRLCDFPMSKRLFGQCFFDPEGTDERIEYGYTYTRDRLHAVFDGHTREEIYAAAERDGIGRGVRRRFTADTLVTNLNKMTILVGKRKLL